MKKANSVKKQVKVKTPTTKKRQKKPVSMVSKETYPRCSRCGSRTVSLERLEQELLVTLSLHCLICGHYTFLGRPLIRLLRRPNVTIPDSIKRPAGT